MSEKRPRRRDARVSSSVTEDVARRAKDKAGRKGRSLSAIIRAFLVAWVDDEYPDPPEIPNEDVRARKRPSKWGKKR